ncbi:MAG: energy-coupled thiamine transporter ThiT, partial [Enterococcus sp.]|nr:energy-coupled thiamine transporter ThiT [Enterococcus sp.]
MDIKNDKKFDTKKLVIIALVVALSVVMGEIKLFHMPQGGSVTLMAMMPVTLVANYYGTKKGIFAGIAYGLLSMIFGVYIIHPLQFVLDYIIAFGALGIGGFIGNRSRKEDEGTAHSHYSVIFCYLIGAFARYFFVCISGAVYFAEYTPEGFNSTVWALYYNACYILPEILLTVIFLMIPRVRRTLDKLFLG